LIVAQIFSERQVADQSARTGVFLADDMPFKEANSINLSSLLSATSDSTMIQAQLDTQD
jgi:hypothetical protein